MSLKTGISTIAVFTIVFTLIALAPVSAAIVHGVVYNWENLKPLPKAIVVVNTTPEQRLVTPNGNYSFNLPPGHYVIRAFYYKNGRLVLYTEDNITIENASGSYIVDLILFPPLNFNFTQPDVEFPAPSATPASGGQNNVSVYVIFVSALIAGVLVAFYLFKGFKKRKVESDSGACELSPEPEKPEPVKVEPVKPEMPEETEVKTEVKEPEKGVPCLPEDLAEALDEIVRAGGRITQKELRKKLGYSEAKVSLILTDLERRGYIEKVKVGRGNVVFLKDEYRKFFGL